MDTAAAAATTTCTSVALASIERIVSLEPIVGADRIEVATVQGWSTVVRKGAFRVGDLCVWHMPDTVLPPLERYAFLADRKYRLRCSRIRGVISEGLALPLDEVLRDCVGEQIYYRMTKDGVYDWYYMETGIVRVLQVCALPCASSYQRVTVTTGNEAANISYVVAPTGMFHVGDVCVRMDNHIYQLLETLSAVFVEGMDVTRLVGISKFHKDEQPAPPPQQRKRTGGTAERPSTFPIHLVPRTDEPHVQSVCGLVNRFAALPSLDELYVSLKMDGTSFSAVASRELSCVCSRNYQLAIDADAFEGNAVVPLDVYQCIARRHDLPASLERYCAAHGGRELAVQGEICGPKVQGNKCGLDELQYFVFSVFDIAAQCYVSLDEMTTIARALGLQCVARLALPSAAVSQPFSRVKQWLEFADSVCYANGAPAEGVVVRTIHASPSGHERTSFKVLSRLYKLKHGE